MAGRPAHSDAPPASRCGPLVVAAPDKADTQQHSLPEPLSSQVGTLVTCLTAISPVERSEDLSRQSREQQGVAGNTAFAYGELNMRDTAWLVHRVASAHMGLKEGGGTLVDLGSGAGNALLAASLPHRFHRAYGIEILHRLHEQAEANLGHWIEAAPARAQCSWEKATPIHRVSFVKGDITTHDWWSDQALAVVLIHATVFDGDLFSSVQLRAEECPVGCWFICVTKELRTGPRTNITTVERVRCQASWGEATVAIQRRVASQGSNGAVW